MTEIEETLGGRVFVIQADVELRSAYRPEDWQVVDKLSGAVLHWQSWLADYCGEAGITPSDAHEYISSMLWEKALHDAEADYEDHCESVFDMRKDEGWSAIGYSRGLSCFD